MAAPGAVADLFVPTEPALPSPLPALLDLQGTVLDATEALDVLQGLLEADPADQRVDDPPTPDPETRLPAVPPALPRACTCPL